MATEIAIPEYPIVDVGYCDRCGEFIRIMDFGAMGDNDFHNDYIIICPNCGHEVEALEWQ